MAKQELKVVELFAGVGGFRLGLENSCNDTYKTIWANQWEPGKKIQHAFNCYIQHFGDSINHINQDINIAIENNLIPDHDLLVGGFPCQDYSVARTQATGIEGKKGVLWWSINTILNSKRPKYVLLENVDRLIKSPTTKRGRDFGVMLRCFYDLDYSVEWRVINAAEYGFAQRRRRVFIFAYQNNTPHHKNLEQFNNLDIINKHGFFAKSFPVLNDNESTYEFTDRNISTDEFDDLVDLSNRFHFTFQNSGIMRNGIIYTKKTRPIQENPTTLGEIRDKNVDSKYFIPLNHPKFTELKGPKKIPRVKPNGDPYFYSEGGMSFPDSLEKPARTMLTSESSINRSTHVIEDADIPGQLRLLTPNECEKLNGFPPGWTDTGMPEKFRYFTMGNALVVPVVTRMADQLKKIL